jgi:DNA polymerase-3 subunit alpha
MAYLTLEDLLGVVEVIIFPDLYKNAADLIVPERLVRITGTVDRGDKGTKIRGSKIEPLDEVQAQTIKRVHIRLTDHPDVTEQLPRLREVFQHHPGSTTVSLTLRVDSALEAETAPLPHLTVTPSERFVADVEEVLGKGAIFLLL